MLRTAGGLALPRRTWSAGFDGGISPSFSIRRRSATRRRGPYRDRTFTGKPLTASLDAQFFRTPAGPRRLSTNSPTVSSPSASVGGRGRYSWRIPPALAPWGSAALERLRDSPHRSVRQTRIRIRQQYRGGGAQRG